MIHDEERAVSGNPGDLLPGFAPAPPDATLDLEPLLRRLLGSTLDLHTLLADSFLNHQARIAQVSQPRLHGM